MKTSFIILFFFVIFIGNPCKGTTLVPRNNLSQEQQYSDTTKEEWKKIAERERMIANQKAAEARIQKEKADRNVSELMKQKELANRATIEAMNLKKMADQSASEAMKQKVLADHMSQEAMKQREFAEQQAIEVKNCQRLSEQRINELTRDLDELKKIIEQQRLIIEDCKKKK